MSIGWNGAATPELPPADLGTRTRLALRGVAALVWTTVMFGLFVVVRAADLVVHRLATRGTSGLAPWVVGAWATGALWLMGLRLQQVGMPMSHAGAIVANHASWLDIVVLQHATRSFFVSKAEVRSWPVIGLIGRAIGTLFVERRAQQSLRQTALLRARLKSGDRMCMFPEGTSTDGQQVLPFKSSLFAVFFEPDLHDRLWLQPVSIRYVARDGLPPAFYGWWGEMDFCAHLMAVLAFSRDGSVRVTFHEPLPAARYSERKVLAAEAGRVVRAGFAAR